jgi:hypothetical protein
MCVSRHNSQLGGAAHARVEAVGRPDRGRAAPAECAQLSAQRKDRFEQMSAPRRSPWKLNHFLRTRGHLLPAEALPLQAELRSEPRERDHWRIMARRPAPSPGSRHRPGCGRRLPGTGIWSGPPRPRAGRHEGSGDVDAQHLGPGPGSGQRRGAVTASRVQDFQPARYTRPLTGASPLERMHRAMRVTSPGFQRVLLGFSGSLP